MSTYAIGDIHGCLVALQTLLQMLSPKKEDTLIFLGDYVNRGPDSKGVIDLLIDLGQSHSVIPLLGNHDKVMLAAYHDRRLFHLWDANVKVNALESYVGKNYSADSLDQVPQEHWHFLKHTCRGFYATNEHIFVHGGIRPHIAPEDEVEETLLWMRIEKARPHQSGRTVICGHSSQTSGKVVDLGHTVCIDTAACKNGWLTGLEVEQGLYSQANEAGQTRAGQP